MLCMANDGGIINKIMDTVGFKLKEDLSEKAADSRSLGYTCQEKEECPKYLGTQRYLW
jgi:hypothetical protein